MSITAININKERPYISKYDNDKEGTPTTWFLGHLDSIMQAQIDDEVTVFEANVKNPEGSSKTTLKLNQSKVELVRFGLKNVENFIHPETKEPIPFKRVSMPRKGKNFNVVSDTFLSLIPIEIIYELADQIKSVNTFTESEEKN